MALSHAVIARAGSSTGRAGRIMKFDTLHEKAWFKSLAAVTTFMVSAVGLIQALGGSWDRSALPERPECCGKLASTSR